MKKALPRLALAASVLALGLLLSPADSRALAVMAAFAVLALLAVCFYERLPVRPRPRRELLLYEATLLLYLGVGFVRVWPTRHALRALLALGALDTLPLRTGTGLYRDASGEIGAFGKDSPYYGQLNACFALEYNSLQKEPEYRAELFEPVG